MNQLSRRGAQKKLSRRVMREGFSLSSAPGCVDAWRFTENEKKRKIFLFLFAFIGGDMR